MNSGLLLAARLARRELRGGLRGFRLFVACLALGVGAIGGVGSLAEAVSGGLERDARRLLGGDVVLRLLHRPVSEEQSAYLAGNARLSETIEMRAMARVAENQGGARTLIELKAVDGSYPLAGTVEIEGGQPLGRALGVHDGLPGAVVEGNLLTKLGVRPGAVLKVGEARFRVTGIIKKEPDRIASVLSFGPRLMIAQHAVAATGLIQPGSQIRYRYRLALPPGEDADGWIRRLKERFPKAGWRIRGLGQAAPGLQRFVDRMALFLTFVGLATLLVGGIGVGNAVSNYLDTKTQTIAILKCLGSSGGLIMRLYFLQIMVLAGLGIGAGLLFAAIIPAGAAWALAGRLPVDLAVGVFPLPLALAAGFGALTAFTFSLWPLGRAARVPGAALFRDRVGPAARLPGPGIRWLVAGGALGLAALTVESATHKGFALWFVGGSSAALIALSVAAWGLARAARRIKTGRHTVLRLALANLHRPGAATSSVTVSLGLGLAVLIAVALIEDNLSRQISERLPKQAPAFFFLDIQPDQVAGFDKIIRGIPETGALRRVASLRGRIVRIAGQPVDQVSIDPGVAWAVRGDRALTYLPRPLEGARIVAGEWWPENYSGPPLISLDAKIARGFGIGLGDTLTLNILGREVEAKIASLRRIDWRSLRFDFAIIFSPGTLEAAPQTHIAALHVAPPAEDLVERRVSDAYANISVIRVRQALAAAEKILSGIGTAVRSTSSLTILAGTLVLAGAVAAARRRRVYDAVVLKVLGARRRTLLAAFLIEYGILGLATGLIAALIGGLTAWAVVVWLMGGQWVFVPGTVAWTLLICILITLVVGFAGTWRALGQKAAPLLRNE